MSNLMKQAAEIFKKGGYEALERWMKSLPRHQVLKLKEEAAEGIAEFLLAAMAFEVQEEIERSMPIKGFSQD